MRTMWGRFAACGIVMALVSVPVSGAKPATAGSKAQKPVTKVSSPKPAKTTTPKSGGAKSTTHGASGKSAKSTTTTTKTKSGKNATGSPSTAASTTTTSTWTPNNPVAEKLSTKPNLLAKVKGALPDGTDLNAATAGFKNFGQFIAATNVSQNLGIDFATLKASMTGVDMTGAKTGEPTLSLGQSIQKLKPGVDGEAQALKAEQLANQQIANTQ